MQPDKAPSWILIPAHNEAYTLPHVIEGVRRCSDAKVLVVNSCSTDSTAEIAVRLADKVVQAETLGYWQAILTGYRYLLTKTSVQAMVQLDADGQHDPLHIPRLFHGLGESDSATWVWGSRHATGSQTEGVLSIGQRLLRGWLYQRTGVRFGDVSSGYWALNKAGIEAFMRYAPPKSTADVVLRLYALQQGVTCREIPMAMSPRQLGMSMHQGICKRLVHLGNVIHDANTFR